jgi:hypothetical protein
MDVETNGGAPSSTTAFNIWIDDDIEGWKDNLNAI